MEEKQNGKVNNLDNPYNAVYPGEPNASGEYRTVLDDMAEAKRVDEMELEEMLEAVRKTKEEAAKRIDIVNNSANKGLARRRLSDIKSMLENAGVEFEFKSRVKEKESAMNKIQKYVDEKGVLDPEMWDTLGMMIIVEDESQCRDILEALESMMDERELCDYITNPKAGYRALHFYTQLEPMKQMEPKVKHVFKAIFSKNPKEKISSNPNAIFLDRNQKERLGSNPNAKEILQDSIRIPREKRFIEKKLGDSDFKIPTEIQIKTRAMAVAQSAIHDSIYKRKGITPEKRDQLSSILFPILEKTYDMYRLQPEAQKNGNQDTINKVNALRSEVEELLDNNVEFLSANREIIDETYKTFAIETIKAHNSKSIGVIENAVKKQLQKVNMGYVAITVDTLLEQHFQSESSFPTRYASDSKNDFVRVSPDPLINEMIYSASLMDKDELRDIIWKNTKYRIDKVRETFIAAESASQEHHVDEETTKEVQDGVAAIMNEMKSSHPSNEDSHNLQDRLDEKTDVEKGHTNGPKKDIIYFWGNATIEENLRKIDGSVLPTERDKLMTDIVNFSRSINRQMDDERIA